MPLHAQGGFGQSGSNKFQPGGGIADLRHFIGSQLPIQCAQVLCEAVEFRSTKNGRDPGLARKQPGQRNLCRHADPRRWIVSRPLQ